MTVGARFVRADLHVHTHGDGETTPTPDFAHYVQSAIDAEIDILAITDHNRVDFVRDVMMAAEQTALFVLPGIEISTHDGHLLALFAPEEVEELEALAVPTNLQLKTLQGGERRSSRSMTDLVGEIHRRGGLAIPAHVDAKDGAGTRLESSEWQELLTSPALAGLEFATPDGLSTWFTAADTDTGRQAAWQARQQISELKERGLARLMSSDAHSPEKVGRDRASRTLTRLRLDTADFSAIRNAIALNPKARCKAEAILPATYPRVVSANFAGGFLDGVEMNFSDNLNCLIGGRGSGKSTALLAIRAALGAKLADDEDPDDPDRMPAKTTIRFIDATGSERIAIREIGQSPVDPGGTSIRLRLADLGQEETGRLARGYQAEPELLLDFLDAFIVRHAFDEREAELLAELDDNASEIERTAGIARQISTKIAEEARLAASLKAAEDGKVDEIAKWAALLASQGPMLADLTVRLNEAAAVGMTPPALKLDGIAEEFGVDLTSPAAAEHVDGKEGLRDVLARFEHRRAEISAKANAELVSAAQDARKLLTEWSKRQDELEQRLAKRQAELEAQGLKVQAGAVRTIAKRLNEVKTSLTNLRKRQDEHTQARRARKRLLDDLHANRERLYQTRKATLKRVADEANSYADDLTIRVSFAERGIDTEWTAWLTEQFSFRRPRVGRVARTVSPREFADLILSESGRSKLLDLRDAENAPCFAQDLLDGFKPTWQQLFKLETMLLPDRPRVEVQRKGEAERKQFDHLSAGQQRSVLLGLLLCAERNEPLVLDQPEDHLDGQYIAGSVVQHLEAAKERRQVIIATHSANLTVLGDAELVIPMVVEDGKGHPSEAGAVDRSETREAVCGLLEGGVDAYKKRGERYGLRFVEGTM